MAELALGMFQQQRQQMLLAPQLRQSLELLQVPVLELRTLVQQELERNPTLEEKPAENERVEVENGEDDAKRAEEQEFQDEFKKLAALDDEWREYFRQSQSVRPYNADEAAKREFLMNSLTRSVSLQEHLLYQLHLASLSEHDQKIGELIIGSITDDGFLTTAPEEMAAAGGHAAGEIERVLATIREFDPIGVAARDLPECLLLQLERLGKKDSLAAKMVQQHLEDLGAKKFAQIAKAQGVTLEAVQTAGRLIATLEPKPGRRFSSEESAYVTPEVLVSKVRGEYVVMMDNEQMPHLSISKHYRQLMEDPATSREVKSYIREKIRAGAFLIKSIQQRQQTIFRIATEIIKVQHDFLERGVTQLKPLTMAQIATIIGVHETTVSRAIANKYMLTPSGLFEMKYFFTPGYQTADGQSVSNKVIKDAIAQLVAAEAAAHPLSDQAIVAKLKEKGMNVARRTIAKYREELKILPSHLRKS
ncbi:MAG: RNA polymerase sigma-54 factor [Verrucomicrobia bacterium]|nr:MAG: RNA polymerase sigma-54 factor [Verrucomicrobiota bacterium]